VALAVGCAVDVSIVNKRPKVNRVTITRWAKSPVNAIVHYRWLRC